MNFATSAASNLCRSSVRRNVDRLRRLERAAILPGGGQRVERLADPDDLSERTDDPIRFRALARLVAVAVVGRARALQSGRG